MSSDARLPPMTGTLLRGLLRRRPGLGGGRTVPRLEARGGPIRVDPEWLAAFRAQIQGGDAGTLPLIAPQLLAGPLHAQLLADPAMPVGMLGLVHVTQRTVRHRDIRPEQPLAFEAWVEGHRVARRGAELDLHTVAFADGEPVWEATTTALARGPWGDESLPGAGGEEPVDPRQTWVLDVPEDTGRRWRRVAGDPNPIHLHALAARPFGFRRAIAHGTWLLGRALATLGEPEGAATVDVRFRRPVPLPSRVELRADLDEPRTRFAIVGSGGEVVHLVGALTRPG